MTSFIENNPDQIVKKDSTFFTKPRSLEFNQTHHKSLNFELKYLYTAITRAKSNLWIYDSDEGKRLPIFHYWEQKGLVRIIRVSDTAEADRSLLFSVASSKEDWILQGDRYRKMNLWEPAMKCYQKAECSHLESEARAYSLVQQADTPGLRQIKITELFLQSAHAFLKRDQYQHDYQSLVHAAKCLNNARKYEESVQLYLFLGQVTNCECAITIDVILAIFIRLKKPSAYVGLKKVDKETVIKPFSYYSTTTTL